MERKEVFITIISFLVGLVIGSVYAESLISNCDIVTSSVAGHVVKTDITMPKYRTMCIAEVR